MKDILQDLGAHTHALGFIPLVKISSTTSETAIEAMAEDRSVIINAKTKAPVDTFDGVFGMPNLNKLDIHLKCPEYKEGAKISVVKAQRNGEEIPTGLHFKNAAGDFQNDYRFMNTDIINEKLKSVKFKGAKWDIVRKKWFVYYTNENLTYFIEKYKITDETYKYIDEYIKTKTTTL